MTRMVLILGPGRCGTSMVSNVLHVLGCNMGEAWTPYREESDPFGTWEDHTLRTLTDDMTEGKISTEAFKPIVAERCRKYKIWGFKTPRLAHVAQHLIPLVDDVRIIAMYRNPDDTVNSAMRAYNIGRYQANAWYRESALAMQARLEEFRGHVLKLYFEDVLAAPDRAVNAIMQFAFSGLPMPHAARYRAALEVIRPKPKRAIEGWGKIVVAARMYKYIAFEWVKSWTAFLTSGMVNTCERILLPEKPMPAHWAANELCREFLGNTDGDTIFLLDDDMTYGPEDMWHMSQHQATWPYDAVMAMCTRRNLEEPSAVVMHHLGKQPMPKALRGDHFTLRANMDPNVTVEPVDSIGLAFTLIRRKVFEPLIDKDHGIAYTDFFRWGSGWEGEDIVFCRDLRELGFRMGIDKTIFPGHITPIAIDWPMVKDRVEALSANQGAVSTQDSGA